VALARLDHMTKHVFIVPGIILAWALLGPPQSDLLQRLASGFLSAVAIASGNYVINEWLDRHFDAFHPSKASRSAVRCNLSPTLVYLEYVSLIAVGLLLARPLGTNFFLVTCAFATSGVIYNVRPFRTKDRAYLDVISESINNPIRLILGWTMIASTLLPPASLVLAYWLGGAFLMSAKRLSEYRDLSLSGELETLRRYRRSFEYYTAENLMVSCFLYTILAAFGIAVFLIRYRLEYIFAFPFIAVLFASYFWLSLRRNSIAQRPERLFRSRRLMLATAFVAAALLVLSFVDMPWLKPIAAPGFVPVDDRR
jgi:4-hydroxybenzoate polyprenyltransferase